ncbi:MAG TPA: HAD-IA family hydrolase [Candidatus Limnocylindria bacterium]|nr:HAD-IA family hydrolase [Candidatus Limnocylindria bacterium]
MSKVDVNQESSEQALGKSLQDARKKAGLTQQQLCQKAGLSYSTLAKIERGAIKAPSIFTIQSIAGALDMSLSDLMGGNAPAQPANTRKRSKSGVRFVYFDINGCLVRFFHRAFARLAHDTGAPADMVETTFWHYNDAVCRGELQMEEFNRLFADHLGIKHLDWQQYYMEAIDPIEEMRELLAWAAEHYHVGLLSNIMPGFIDEMFERGILPDVPYASIIDSSKVGAIKPEPRIYEVAQDWAECDPSEILLIDDSRTNLMAAERMGWHVLWFDDYRPEESVAHVRGALELEE